MASLVLRHRAIASSKIERWLGAGRAEQVSGWMRGWYGPPIHLLDVPGTVRIGRDGDFSGRFVRGGAWTALDALAHHVDRLVKGLAHPRPGYLYAGFSSISQALQQSSGGSRQQLNGNLAKSGVTGVVAACNSLWGVGSMPAAGAAGSAAPGGRAPTDATTGAMFFTNPASGTLRLVGADFAASVVNNGLCLYDRIFDVAKTMNSTGTEAVTGTPSRFASTTPTSEDYAGGNFLFVETQTALANTAHNWTTCTYTDQDGNAGATLPSLAGIAQCIQHRFDMPTNTWFAPLASGDTGIGALTQMQCSAAVATGAINFVIGHPIGFMTFPIASLLLPFDWLTNRDQAPYVPNDACLALFELPKPATTATTYSGRIYVNATPS